jgi:hypothetical protein
MGLAADLARKACALFAALMALAGPAHAACVDPFQIPVAYGTADFTQTRHLSGVRAPLVSRGAAAISANRVEWHVAEPMDIRTTIAPDGITQSIDNGPPQRLGPQGGGDAFLSSAGLFELLVGNFEALRAHYDVTRADSAASAGWTVRLAPRAESLSRFISAIEVSGCDRVQTVDVRQANGDWMEIALGPVRS